jgi:hypothetical protein
LVSIPGDFVALSLIRGDAADIRHKDARLAWDIRPEVPGIGEQVECRIGDLVDVLDPFVLGLLGGFNSG